MGINKNFVVKNGLEVSTNLILADSTTNRVGIASTTPRTELDVRGGIAATNTYFTGISTVLGELNVGSDGSTFTAIGGSYIGIGTALPEYLLDVRSPVSTGQTALYVYGDLEVTGDLRVDDISFDQANVNNLNVTGVSTLGTVQVSSGIVTATSGIVTYYGDGSQLEGVIGGIGINTEGGLVGFGITYLHLRGAGISTTFYDSSSGIATVFLEGGGGGSISISTTPPVSPTPGDLWYSPDYGRTFIYYDESTVGYGTDSQWIDASPFNTDTTVYLTPGKTVTTFVATGGQTTFSVSYEIGYIEVYLNGTRLSSSEYTAADGSTVNLTSGATNGDILDIVEFRVGIGDTGPRGPQGPLPTVGEETSAITHYPLFVAGLGTTAATITTTSNYFGFIPGTGTLNVNQLIVAGVTTSTDFDSTSDINLKENIEIIENSLDKVVGIRGVTFNWKDSKIRSAGVIAQEVEKVLPEVTKESDGHKVVNYNGLIGLLIEAVKEQQVEINNLKERIEALEN